MKIPEHLVIDNVLTVYQFAKIPVTNVMVNDCIRNMVKTTEDYVFDNTESSKYLFDGVKPIENY